MGWFDEEDDALDLDWGGGGRQDVYIPSFFELPSFDLPSFDLPSFDFGSFNASDALDLDWGDTSFDLSSFLPDFSLSDFGLPSLSNIGSDVFQGVSNLGSDIYRGVSDLGSDIYGGISDLFSGPSYADMEDMDAGRYLDEQYAADILEGIDRSDADAELFRQQAVEDALKNQIDFADQQDMDAARYLDELQGMDTSGFNMADQEDIDREMYRQEILDSVTAGRDPIQDIIDMADQEDIDREMYRKEQEDLGITREGTASGKFTDVSGGKGTTNITKEDLTKKDTEPPPKKPGGDGKITDILKDKDNQLLMMLLGGLLGLMGNKGGGAPVGYKGGIPTYTATRGTPVSPTAGGRRAGGAGLGSLTGGVTYTKAAQGGLMDVMAGQPNESVLMMAKGGKTGRYLRGATDGMADKIYTDIEGQQPARLSHGEFVIPADVVSHLGNGNSDAGAKELHDMMNRVRKARTGTTKQGKEIKPRKHMAA